MPKTQLLTSTLSPKKLKTSHNTDNREVITCRIMHNKMIGLIFCSKGTEKHDDGFWPFTVGLAKNGDNTYKVCT
jgi:predicted dienelactone hydrolase